MGFSPKPTSGSSRRDRTASGSSRRADFDVHRTQSSSARRISDSPAMAGSSSRKMFAAQGSKVGEFEGGGRERGLSGLSEQQQSATRSAVSMNSIWNEARKEIRRGTARDSAIRAAAERTPESRTAAAESEALLSSAPPTPAVGATPGKDLEAAVPEGPAELDFTTDLQALRDMLREDPVLASMLLCIPLGIAAHFTGIGGVSAAFILNFVAIIPLAWMLGNATEELALRSNQTLGGLLNATFGNAVELIVSIVALRKGMIKLVQTSLLGSILSNCLLVLGMAFFLGGLKNKVQAYNNRGAHMLSSLLLLSAIALVLPAAFVNSFTPHPSMSHLLQISRVTAALMFCIYLLYLFFQLFTHAEMFEDESNESFPEVAGLTATAPHSPTAVEPHQAGRRASMKHAVSSLEAARALLEKNDVAAAGYQASSAAAAAADAAAAGNSGSDIEEESDDVAAVNDHMNELSDLSPTMNGHKGAKKNTLPASIAEDEESRASGSPATMENEPSEDGEADDEDEPQLTFLCSLTLLILVTLAVAVCSEFLVDSIDELTRSWGVNESFVGIILLPIVGNAAEHATAVTVAMKDKMDLAIGVAIGSSTQIALFLIPFVTLLGWVISQPMSLNFSGFETICLVMAVLLVSTLLKTGESNWLQGVMLIALYIIIATGRCKLHEHARRELSPALAIHLFVSVSAVCVALSAFWYVPETPDDPHYQNHATNSWAASPEMRDEPLHAPHGLKHH